VVEDIPWNKVLTDLISEEEVWETVRMMKKKKAVGPWKEEEEGE